MSFFFSHVLSFLGIVLVSIIEFVDLDLTRVLGCGVGLIPLAPARITKYLLRRSRQFRPYIRWDVLMLLFSSIGRVAMVEMVVLEERTSIINKARVEVIGFVESVRCAVRNIDGPAASLGWEFMLRVMSHGS